MTQEASKATEKPAQQTDGRRRRGQTNRASIVDAMLEIIRTGDMSPSAEQVAARADVGLRTQVGHGVGQGRVAAWHPHGGRADAGVRRQCQQGSLVGRVQFGHGCMLGQVGRGRAVTCRIAACCGAG